MFALVIDAELEKEVPAVVGLRVTLEKLQIVYFNRNY